MEIDEIINRKFSYYDIIRNETSYFTLEKKYGEYTLVLGNIRIEVVGICRYEDWFVHLIEPGRGYRIFKRNEKYYLDMNFEVELIPMDDV